MDDVISKIERGELDVLVLSTDDTAENYNSVNEESEKLIAELLRLARLGRAAADDIVDKGNMWADCIAEKFGIDTADAEFCETCPVQRLCNAAIEFIRERGRGVMCEHDYVPASELGLFTCKRCGADISDEKLVIALKQQIKAMANCTNCEHMTYHIDGDTSCAKGAGKCKDFDLWQWDGEQKGGVSGD